MSRRNTRTTGPAGTIATTRATRLIVASGSLLAIIVIGLPWVDEYLRLRREAAEYDELQIQLADTQLRQEQMDRIDIKISDQLNRMVARTTDPAKTQAVREQLIDFVRQAGGRIRRLEIDDGRTRAWAAEGDDPRYDSMPLDEQESRFVLHSHNVELQAEGSLQTVQQVLQSIADQGWLMTTKSLSVMPTGIPQSPVKLELQLVLYGLGPAEQEPEELFAQHREPTELR